MPKLKVRFDEPEHGWIGLFIWADGEPVVQHGVSRIYPSFEQLVTALGAMLDPKDERLIVWMEEPGEIELRFSRRDDLVRLEVTFFEDNRRPLDKGEPDFSFSGSYDEICIPFWRALRDLEGRYPQEELQRRWKEYFPHRELGLLTQLLGKN